MLFPYSDDTHVLQGQREGGRAKTPQFDKCQCTPRGFRQGALCRFVNGCAALERRL